ncbi:hypothetical protein KGG70_gp54 [Streptomyces phage Celia]|uniref:DUF2746 domain-containing protein n=1 Tax=Streptomyces phage Celia TaxID=2590946 RepID=A0A516KRB2_9CAUD|nr:hypothetical protein KGG70_gp54 [Streptomyces phage Celia]QDP44230.1 hypothetical protein SEA_CELIA_27 [Streptomyces phage Celia]QFG10490.1 membrane protein [Streptomyces phage Urza]QJD50592.1 membrane protein [Streptomyces phage Itza]
MTTLALSPATQVALISTGGTIVVAVIGVLVEFLRRQSSALNEVRENTAEARNQVANSHQTNLRDDMDRLHDDVRAVLELVTEHGQDIRGLRSELQQERRERLSVSERLDDHVAAMTHR